MMPRAKMVSRRMLPPANRSKNPKMVPWLREKKSVQRWMLIPGVGMCAQPVDGKKPKRKQNPFAQVRDTKNVCDGFEEFHDLASASLLLRGRRPDDYGLAARFLDFFESGLRKQMRLYTDLARQLARSQNLQTVTQFVHHAQFGQPVWGELVAFELI